MGETRESRAGRAGTAAKSLALTFAQLDFLSKKDNASAWVRRAVDMAMDVETGGSVIVKVDGSLWSRLAMRCAKEQKGGLGIKPWSEVLELTLDAIEAAERANAAEAAANIPIENRRMYNEFHKANFKIGDELRKLIAILEAGPFGRAT
jgi:hypothetical protein